MANTLPIEVLALFMGMSAVMIGVGASQNKGLIIMMGGMFVLVFAVYPDVIIMGNQVTSSTTSGSTTTYTYGNANFTIPPLMKVSMATLGVLVMVVGIMISKDVFK